MSHPALGEQEGGGAEDLSSSAQEGESWRLACAGEWKKLLVLTTCFNCS